MIMLKLVRLFIVFSLWHVFSAQAHDLGASDPDRHDHAETDNMCHHGWVCGDDDKLWISGWWAFHQHAPYGDNHDANDAFSNPESRQVTQKAIQIHQTSEARDRTHYGESGVTSNEEADSYWCGAKKLTSDFCEAWRASVRSDCNDRQGSEDECSDNDKWYGERDPRTECNRGNLHLEGEQRPADCP